MKAMIHLPVDVVERFVVDVFTALGVPEDEARIYVEREKE